MAKTKKKAIKALSLFDGISCAHEAISRLRRPILEYHASEIDRYAITISRRNWPRISHIGGVQGVNRSNFPHLFDGSVDLLIGGSPCQDLSIAKKNRKGLDGDRSGLFWEYVRILREVKPKYFVLENVASMPKESRDTITKELGVEPIMIDAALVSAQRRKRLFWTNIPGITLPDDRGIFLKDILQDDSDIAFDVYNDKFIPNNKAKTLGTNPQCRTAVAGQLVMKQKSNTIRAGGRSSGIGDRHEWDSVYQYRRTYWRETKGGKVPTLTANMGMGGHNVPFILQTARGKNNGGKKYGKVPTLSCSKWEHNNKLNGVRKLTPLECERLQSLPDGYTEGVSNTQRYIAIGNAFNVDVVAHILSFMP